MVLNVIIILHNNASGPKYLIIGKVRAVPKTKKQKAINDTDIPNLTNP
jgi:hypothetical protein